MREIKFRAWHIGKEKYLDLTDHVWEFFDDGIFRLYYKKSGMLEQIANDKHVEIEQFTGLKDSNGKEIFEGDILRWDDSKDNGFSSSGGVHTEAAKYDNGEWRLGEFYGLPMVIENEYATVIGNIHENGNLLTN